MRYVFMLATAAACAAEPTPELVEGFLSEQYVSYPAGLVAEVAALELADGTPIWVAVDGYGHPMFVAYDPTSDAGYWTPTVDYVFTAAGGYCSYP